MTTETDCPFKSAKELGLTPQEWEALIMTLVAMENGMLHYTNKDPDIHEHEPLPAGHLYFNMDHWNLNSPNCGSVCCIGGSAEVLGRLNFGDMGRAARRLVSAGKYELSSLFYAYPDSRVTPERAARTLRGYLTTGRTDWEAH